MERKIRVYERYRDGDEGDDEAKAARIYFERSLLALQFSEQLKNMSDTEVIGFEDKICFGRVTKTRREETYVL